MSTVNEDMYVVKVQQGLSQPTFRLPLKDANALNDILVRNKYWHTITDANMVETVFNVDNSHLYDEKGRLKMSGKR